MANATLTFGVDLSQFNQALNVVNRQAKSINDTLQQGINSATRALKNGVGELKTSVDVSNTKAQISKLRNDIQKAVQAKAQIDISNAKARISELKGEIIAAVGSLAILKAPIQSAMSFESAMADVKKVADFSSNAEFQAYKQQILEMSRTIPLSVNELAQISASGGQLGIATGQLAKFTEITAKLSTAFDMSSEEAGDTIAKMMNVYGLSLDKVRDLGDTMNYLSDGMASKAKDIASIMKDIGGTGTLFGLSPDSLAAISSTMLALGVDASSAGTSLNSFFGQMMSIEQTPKFQKAFASIGGDAKKLADEIKADPQKALDKFFNTLNTAPKDQLMPVLINMFGKEHAPKIALMINSLDEYKKAKDRAFSDEKLGSAEREFQTRSATTTNNLQLMKNSMNEIAINIGSVLLPAFNALLNGVKKVSEWVASFTQAFPNLTKWIAIFIASIALAKAAILGLAVIKSVAIISFASWAAVISKVCILCTSFGGVLGILKTAILAVPAILGKVTIAFNLLKVAFLSNPIGAVLMAIASAAVLIYTYWDEIKAFLIACLEVIKSAFSSAWEWIKGIFIAGSEVIRGIFTSLFEWIASKIEAVMGVINSVKNMVSSVTDSVSLATSSAWNSTKEFFGFGDNNTNGAVEQVRAEKVSQMSSNTSQTIHDNKTINVTMNGANATPEQVAKTLNENSYTFAD